MTVYFGTRIYQNFVGTLTGISSLSLIRKFLLATFTDSRKFCNPRTCHTRHVMIRDVITRDFIMCPFYLFITLLLSFDDLLNVKSVCITGNILTFSNSIN